VSRFAPRTSASVNAVRPTASPAEFGGQKLEVLELGTAARHQDGDVALTLPPDTCWAYRDEGQSAID